MPDVYVGDIVYSNDTFGNDCEIREIDPSEGDALVHCLCGCGEVEWVEADDLELHGEEVYLRYGTGGKPRYKPSGFAEFMRRTSSV